MGFTPTRPVEQQSSPQAGASLGGVLSQEKFVEFALLLDFTHLEQHCQVLRQSGFDLTEVLVEAALLKKHQ